MSRRLKGLRQRLITLDEEIEIAEAELSTINDDVNYKRKERALNTLYSRYDTLEAEIQELELKSSKKT